MKISASIIVKNEANHIEKMLSSVVGIDEIVICDTGSEDNTVELAKMWTDKVYEDYKWNDNFAEARNHVLSKCTGDWILIIDADESLETSVEELKAAVDRAEAKGFKTISCRVISNSGTSEHRQPRLFKRCPEVFWKGAIHNYLSVVEKNPEDVVIHYGYSDAHRKDPDRALRILTKVVTENSDSVREKYYLAREYWYRRDYKTALHWYDKYLEVATWLPEKTDGYLMAARCAWYSREGERARAYCIQAIRLNPNFKEALLLMSEMTYEPSKTVWKKFADIADNSGVLFIRK